MVMPVAEQEAPSKLEAILAEPSDEEAEVSEETPKEEVVEEVTEPEKVDPIFESKVQTEVQSRSDKLVNEYRAKRETDTALLRDLQAKLREANKQSRTKASERLISSILATDADEGFTEEETKSRESKIKALDQRYQELFTKEDDIEETADFISEMSEKLPKNIVDKFGLNDPNVHIRAANGVNFVNESINLHKRNLAFQEVVDVVLAKGSEVRQKIEGFTNELMELSDKKGRDLLLEKVRSGLKTTPKKAPTVPSGALGGEDRSNMTPRAKIQRGLEKEAKNK